jgi:hypothetical protein
VCAISRDYCPKRTVVPEIAEAIMPLQYRVPGYLGNALLLSLGLFMVGDGNIAIGITLAALSALNLFLVYKLDWFSREEGLLAHQLEIAKMREALLVAKKRIEELETESSAPHQG